MWGQPPSAVRRSKSPLFLCLDFACHPERSEGPMQLQQKLCGDSRPRLSGGANLRCSSVLTLLVILSEAKDLCSCSKSYVGTAALGCPAERISASSRRLDF